MNYSRNMKGWKNKMDNNTTYGRKVVRNSSKRKQANKNFIVFTIAVLVIGILIGCIVAKVTSRPKVETTSEKNEYIMQHVNEYGSYDGRVFTSEMSMDWSGDEYEFTPLDCSMDEGTQEFVFYLCKGYDIDWTLVMSLIQKESSFKANAVSSTGDYGLMQINQMNHEWLTEVLGVTDFLDSEQNIRSGVFVLRKLFEEYTDKELVLMCYNMGEDGASKLWDKGIYSTSYTEDIIKIQEGFIDQLERKDGTK